MAQFNYAAYAAQQAARQTNSKGDLPKTHFMGEFLKNDGDFAVVRFPYTSMNDLVFESVHKVMGVFPNNIYGKFVTCTGDATCPLCAHADDATRKTQMKFYAKMIVYTLENGSVVENATVWERPSMFGDSDLKNLMTEYGDLTKYLFKISRTGSGTATRYNIIPVNAASPVYAGYPTSLDCIKDIDPVKILAKTVEQYNAALNPTTNTVQPQTVVTTHVTQQPVVTQPSFTNQTQTVTVPSQPVVQPQVTVQPQPVPQTVGRYKF
jgi:hypothetical protein